MKSTTHSSLFRYIERLQGDQPWGELLDAGTGVKSIGWVASLPTERWTAVTGAAGDAAKVHQTTQDIARPQDQIVLGNWADAGLLKDEVYDTVLADYLLGAVEGFAPCFQPYLFLRLRPLTRRRLYVIGVEPYVPAERPETRAGQLVWEIGRFRDACLLLAGEMPYREYPAPWVVDQLKRAGFAVRDMKSFAIQYKARFVNTQIDLCQPRLEQIDDRMLAQALRAKGEALRAEALDLIKADGALRHGQDYVIAAEPV
ncbi:MAG: class I SAM-dependent methyltransferase [Pseudomonadota bacterium]